MSCQYMPVWAFADIVGRASPRILAHDELYCRMTDAAGDALIISAPRGFRAKILDYSISTALTPYFE